MDARTKRIEAGKRQLLDYRSKVKPEGGTAKAPGGRVPFQELNGARPASTPAKPTLSSATVAKGHVAQMHTSKAQSSSLVGHAGSARTPAAPSPSINSHGTWSSGVALTPVHTLTTAAASSTSNLTPLAAPETPVLLPLPSSSNDASLVALQPGAAFSQTAQSNSSAVVVTGVQPLSVAAAAASVSSELASAVSSAISSPLPLPATDPRSAVEIHTPLHLVLKRAAKAQTHGQNIDMMGLPATVRFDAPPTVAKRPFAAPSASLELESRSTATGGSHIATMDEIQALQRQVLAVTQQWRDGVDGKGAETAVAAYAAYADALSRMLRMQAAQAEAMKSAELEHATREFAALQQASEAAAQAVTAESQQRMEIAAAMEELTMQYDRTLVELELASQQEKTEREAKEAANNALVELSQRFEQMQQELAAAREELGQVKQEAATLRSSLVERDATEANKLAIAQAPAVTFSEVEQQLQLKVNQLEQALAASAAGAANSAAAVTSLQQQLAAASKEADDLRVQSRRLELECADLNVEAQAKAAMAAAAGDAASSAAHDLSELTHQAVAAQTLEAEWSAKLTAAEQRAVDAAERVKELELELSSKNEEIASANEHLSALKAVAGSSSEGSAAVAAQLEQLHAALLSAKEDAARAQAAATVAHEQHAVDKQRLAEASEAVDRMHQAHHAQLEALAAAQQKTIHDTYESYQMRSESAGRREEAAMQKAAAPEAQVAALQAAVDAAVSNAQQAEQARSGLEADMDMRIHAAVEAAKVQFQEEATASFVASAANVNEASPRSKQRAEEIEQLTAKVRTDEEAVATLRAELTRAVCRSDSLEDSVRQLQLENQQLKTQVQAAVAAKAIAESELASAERTCENNSNELEQVHANVFNLRHQVRQLQLEAAEAQARIVAVEEQASSSATAFAAEAATLRSDVAAATAQYTAAQVHCEALQLEKERERAASMTARHELATLTAKLAELESSAQEQLASRECAERLADELQANTKVLNEQLASAASVEAELRNVVAEQLVKARKLEAERDTLYAEIAAARADAANWQLKAQGAEAEACNAKQIIEGLEEMSATFKAQQAKFASLRDVLQEREAEVEQLRGELQATQAAAAAPVMFAADSTPVKAALAEVDTTFALFSPGTSMIGTVRKDPSAGAIGAENRQLSEQLISLQAISESQSREIAHLNGLLRAAKVDAEVSEAKAKAQAATIEQQSQQLIVTQSENAVLKERVAALEQASMAALAVQSVAVPLAPAFSIDSASTSNSTALVDSRIERLEALCQQQARIIESQAATIAQLITLASKAVVEGVPKAGEAAAPASESAVHTDNAAVHVQDQPPSSASHVEGISSTALASASASAAPAAAPAAESIVELAPAAPAVSASEETVAQPVAQQPLPAQPAARVVRSICVRPSGDIEVAYGSATPVKPPQPSVPSAAPTDGVAPHEAIAQQLRLAQANAVLQDVQHDKRQSSGTAAVIGVGAPAVRADRASMWERAVASAGPATKPRVSAANHAPVPSHAAADHQAAERSASLDVAPGSGQWAEGSLADMAARARKATLHPLPSQESSKSTHSPNKARGKSATLSNTATISDVQAALAAAQAALKEDIAAGRPADRELVQATLVAAQVFHRQQAIKHQRSSSMPPVACTSTPSGVSIAAQAPAATANRSVMFASEPAAAPQLPHRGEASVSHQPSKPGKPPRPAVRGEEASSAAAIHPAAMSSPAPAAVNSARREATMSTPAALALNNSWVSLPAATITTSIRAMSRIQGDDQTE